MKHNETMTDIEKIRILLPHWIEHNKGHGIEFQQWSEKLQTDSPEISHLLDHAVKALHNAQSALEEALAKAGGSSHSTEIHHHHTHGENGDHHH